MGNSHGQNLGSFARPMTLRFVARGMAAPASATAPPLTRRGAACAGGWPFLAAGAAPGGLASRHTSWSGRARLRLGRCPRRKDRRGSCRHGGILRGGFSRALWSGIRRTGFGWGRALGCGTRLTPPRAQPRLRSAFVPTRFAVRTHLRAPHKPAEDGGFALALVRPRLPRPFFVQNRSLWGRKWPPQRNFDQKTGSEGAARPPATRPDPFRCAKVSGPLAFGGQPASSGLLTAPVTVPTARGASGLGAGLAARRGTVSQSPDIF